MMWNMNLLMSEIESHNLNGDLTSPTAPFPDKSYRDNVDFDKDFEGVPMDKILGTRGTFKSQNPDSGKGGFKFGANGAIDVGKLFFNRQFIMTFFESLDGWTTTLVGSGAATPRLGSATLSGPILDDEAEIVSKAGSTAFVINWDSKNPMFESYVDLSASSNITVRFGIGDLSALDSGGTTEGFGFKYTGGVLSALSLDDGVESLTTITGITVTNVNRYSAIMDSSNKSIKFYINGNHVATHDSGDELPDGTSSVLLSFYYKNNTSTIKFIGLHNTIFAQDL